MIYDSANPSLVYLAFFILRSSREMLSPPCSVDRLQDTRYALPVVEHVRLKMVKHAVSEYFRHAFSPASCMLSPRAITLTLTLVWTISILLPQPRTRHHFILLPDTGTTCFKYIICVVKLNLARSYSCKN